MPPLFPFLTAFFAASQRGLRPLRKRGLMGTSDHPRFFAAGDAVPWWVMCRWPLGLPITFTCDCETFWEGGAQQVHPLWDDERYLIQVGDAGGRYTEALLTGAPTNINTRPRPNKPKPVRQAAEALMQGA